MEPKCIVLDEPTAMLDPNGRKEVIKLSAVCRRRKVTVILITHYMEEVIEADQVFVMDKGHVVMHGTPKEVFSQEEKLKKYRLDVPHRIKCLYCSDFNYSWYSRQNCAD